MAPQREERQRHILIHLGAQQDDARTVRNPQITDLLFQCVLLHIKLLHLHAVRGCLTFLYRATQNLIKNGRIRKDGRGSLYTDKVDAADAACPGQVAAQIIAQPFGGIVDQLAGGSADAGAIVQCHGNGSGGKPQLPGNVSGSDRHDFRFSFVDLPSL